MDASFNQPLLTKAKSDHKKKKHSKQDLCRIYHKISFDLSKDLAIWKTSVCSTKYGKPNTENPTCGVSIFEHPNPNRVPGLRHDTIRTPSPPPVFSCKPHVVGFSVLFCKPRLLGNCQRETVKLTPPARSETGPRSLPTRTTPAPQSGSGP